MNFFSIIGGLLLLTRIAALPVDLDSSLGISFQANETEPLLKLDYATYKGTYNQDTDIYHFNNIRFAAPPIGNLRWKKPMPPAHESDIQNGIIGHSCIQYMPISTGGADYEAKDDEDCLFLDLRVPGVALRNTSLRLPVANWIYPGAYIFGSKNSPDVSDLMVSNANNSFIWIAGNYRLGPYGFLAGSTIEKEGVPNAGIWDQRALLEWVQKYINLVGGDSQKVTAMGLSAGAGSIMHHLVAEGGTLDPLFSRAILLSPGYMNFQDRNGAIEENYKKFEEYAGCTGKGLSCLRDLNSISLRIAADKANALAQPGSFTFGPSPDGSYIRNTPTLEFSNGNYWKGLDKIINSHVLDEGSLFIDHLFVNDTTFTSMLETQFGDDNSTAQLLSEAMRLYPPINYLDSPYKFEQDRIASYITESYFTCHNRLVADAYAGRVYSVNYAVAPATHGSDASAVFFNAMGAKFRGIPPESVPDRMAYQSYFISFLRDGNPNTYRNAETIEWPLTTSFNESSLSNVLKFTYPIGKDGFALVADDEQEKLRCSFWLDAQKAVQAVLNDRAKRSR